MSAQLPLGDLSKFAIPTLPGMQSPKPQPGFWSSNPVFSYLNDVYSSVSDHRKSLGLINPGTVEDLNREVSRDVLLGQYFFTGLRADLTKNFSTNPYFQITHSLSIGSQMMPPYAFTSLYATDDLVAQGTLDNNFALNGRVHYEK